MICKSNVQDNMEMCPNCGAMPWRIPDVFLNAEQHHSWLENIYKPQLERWEQWTRIHVENNILREENEKLRAKLDELSFTIPVESSEARTKEETSKPIPLMTSFVYLPPQLVKRKRFLREMSPFTRFTRLNDEDKIHIYYILQNVYQYGQALAQIPASKHGLPRNEMIQDAKQYLKEYIEGDHSVDEAFIILVTRYIMLKYPEWDERELQITLRKVIEAIQRAR